MPIVFSPVSTCAKNIIRLNVRIGKQISANVCSVVSKSPSCSCCCLYFHSACSQPKYTRVTVSGTTSCSLVIGSQALKRSCLGSGFSKQRIKVHQSLRSSTEHQTTCLAISVPYRNMSLKLSVRKQKTLPKIKWTVGSAPLQQEGACAGLILGGLVCFLCSEPVHAEAAQCRKDEDDHDSSCIGSSHGKKVHTDYSITGIPGDGRCLFRSVVYGACLRSGKPSPSESLQKALADELRANVADEFIKRREETEWFVEGDFDTYVSQIRQPHVWGGEPELFMSSHVLRMPITVYMHDEDSGGLIAIAEYGQEYGKENPIRVLYHGYGHYDALLIPGKKDHKSRL